MHHGFWNVFGCNGRARISRRLVFHVFVCVHRCVSDLPRFFLFEAVQRTRFHLSSQFCSTPEAA